MTDREISPMLALVPCDFETSLERQIDLKDLPHIQRLAGLVYFFLVARERFDQDSINQLKDAEDEEIERLKREEPQLLKPGFSFFEHLVNTDWRELYLGLAERNSKQLPEILTAKIAENGDVFGFGELTRAILEMANDRFENEKNANKTTFERGSFPRQTKFFEHVMFEMLTRGLRVGSESWYTTYPAGEYYSEIFPPEVLAQMRPMYEDFERTRYW